MAAGEVDLLARPESPGAHHQEAAQPHQDQPGNGDPPLLDRIAVKEMHGGGQQARRRRNRHAHKIFASRPSRIARLRVVADVEARQPRDPADEKQETDEGAGVEQVLMQLRIDGIGQKMESPDERQQAGRHAKGDGVGQRIQLLAKLAARYWSCGRCGRRARRREWRK